MLPTPRFPASRPPGPVDSKEAPWGHVDFPGQALEARPTAFGLRGDETDAAAKPSLATLRPPDSSGRAEIKGAASLPPPGALDRIEIKAAAVRPSSLDLVQIKAPAALPPPGSLDRAEIEAAAALLRPEWGKRLARPLETLLRRAGGDDHVGAVDLARLLAEEAEPKERGPLAALFDALRARKAQGALVDPDRATALSGRAGHPGFNARAPGEPQLTAPQRQRVQQLAVLDLYRRLEPRAANRDARARGRKSALAQPVGLSGRRKRGQARLGRQPAWSPRTAPSPGRRRSCSTPATWFRWR